MSTEEKLITKNIFELSQGFYNSLTSTLQTILEPEQEEEQEEEEQEAKEFPVESREDEIVEKEEEQQNRDYQTPQVNNLSNKLDEITIGLTCRTCGCTFETLDEQRNHFKLDWHRYNMKRKVLGKDPVDEVNFESMVDESLGKEKERKQRGGEKNE